MSLSSWIFPETLDPNRYTAWIPGYFTKTLAKAAISDLSFLDLMATTNSWPKLTKRRDSSVGFSRQQYALMKQFCHPRSSTKGTGLGNDWDLGAEIDDHAFGQIVITRRYSEP